MNLHDLFLSTSGICTDSRRITPGCMFFALRGATFNGNTFALQALQQGASFAVVDEDVSPDEARCIRVPNVLQALQDLALAHRRYLALPILAITGTNGKTTTKELVWAVLSRKFRTVATQGNLNNHIGVPLTLLGMDKGTEMGVVEMGANHPGEIAALCAIAQPNAGLITNVGKAHLEGFGSLDGVKKTKGELYEYLAQHDGFAFCCADSADLQEMLRERGVQHAMRYGLSVDGVRVMQDDGSPFLRLQINGEQWQTQLVGSYNAANVLAAIAVGRFYGVAESDIRAAVEGYAPQNHRSQLLRTSANTVIVDAYNANPSSMEAAIRNFAQLSAGAKLLILGDMLELGGDAQREHERIVELLREVNAGEVLLVGSEFGKAAGLRYQSFADSEALCSYLTAHPVAGRLVLLKGSHGVQLEKAVGKL